MSLASQVTSLALRLGKEVKSVWAAFGLNPSYIAVDAGSSITTPSSAALNAALSTTDVICRVSCNSWTAFQTFTTKGVALPQYAFGLSSTGQLTFIDSGGATRVSSANLAATPDGTRLWVRVSRNSATGVIKFYWAADMPTEPTVWTQLGADVAGAAGAFTTNATVLSVAGLGTISRVIIRDGFTGVTVAELDTADYLSGTSWVSLTTGETWTLTGTAVYTRALPAISAFIRTLLAAASAVAARATLEAARMNVQPGQPATPADGDLWWDTDDTSLIPMTVDLSAYQPVDSDLTAIAALATTAYGRAFLALADAAAARTAISAAPASQGATVGSVVVGANQAGVGGASTPLTGFSIPFTAVAGRRYVMFWVLTVSVQTTAGGLVNFDYQLAGVDQAIISSDYTPVIGVPLTYSGFVDLGVLGAGSKTISISGRCSAGTMTISNGSANNGRMSIFDMGT